MTALWLDLIVVDKIHIVRIITIFCGIVPMVETRESRLPLYLSFPRDRLLCSHGKVRDSRKIVTSK